MARIWKLLPPQVSRFPRGPLLAVCPPSPPPQNIQPEKQRDGLMHWGEQVTLSIPCCFPPANRGRPGTPAWCPHLPQGSQSQFHTFLLSATPARRESVEKTDKGRWVQRPHAQPYNAHSNVWNTPEDSFHWTKLWMPKVVTSYPKDDDQRRHHQSYLGLWGLTRSL